MVGGLPNARVRIAAENGNRYIRQAGRGTFDAMARMSRIDRVQDTPVKIMIF